MSWRDALFAHWRVAPRAVAELLPPGLDPATRDGAAWVGVVTFEMADIRPRGSPVGLGFGEVNLRTYVEGPDGGRGVYFLSLDADDEVGVGVARAAYDLPYYRARIDVSRDGETVTVRSSRVHGGAAPATLDVSYRPAGGEATPADPGSLGGFLTERYRFYLPGDRAGAIAHDPWRLTDATIDLRRESLFAAAGLERPETDPVLHYSPGSEVTAGGVDRIEASGDDAGDDLRVTVDPDRERATDGGQR
ncbi:MAG: YqjF family protein [Haloferacaceae archaeon]